MRAVLGFSLLLAIAHAGCTPVREIPQIPNQYVDPSADAWVGGRDSGPIVPGQDAWVPPQSDAWVPPASDAGNCPSYANDVEPIYRMHCATCHTVGGDAHFGSSYTVANQSFSSCGNSMAQCTIDRGMPGGDMSFNDPLGGFATTEIATISAWIDCGRPR